MGRYATARRPPATNDEVLTYSLGQVWGEDHPGDLQGGLADTVGQFRAGTAIAALCDRLGSVTFWSWWRQGFDKGAGI